MKKKYFFYFFLFFLALILAFFFFLQRKENFPPNFIFSYPDINTISFAWEKVPMDEQHFYNKERFDKEYIITSTTLYQFYLYIKRYPLYVPFIEKKLAEKNMPLDLKYIPIAESALKNDIVSSVWASWIWQFMPETAKRFWLQVNEDIDERYNFEKSTNAALEYLQVLHKKFWNRTLATAAYNRGENGLSKAMEKQGVTSYYDLYLNEETSRYIFRIIAIKYLIESYFKQEKVLSIIIGKNYENPPTNDISVEKIEDIASWAKENKQNYNTIKILNPWILGESLPEWTWKIKILK
jgi:membrane-bound lytic murein transglycosylase D